MDFDGARRAWRHLAGVFPDATGEAPADAAATIRTWRRLWNMAENKHDHHSPTMCTEPERPRASKTRDVNVWAVGKFAIGLVLLVRRLSWRCCWALFKYFESRPAGQGPREPGHASGRRQAAARAAAAEDSDSGSAGRCAPRRTRCWTATAGWTSSRASCAFRSIGPWTCWRSADCPLGSRRAAECRRRSERAHRERARREDATAGRTAGRRAAGAGSDAGESQSEACCRSSL